MCLSINCYGERNSDVKTTTRNQIYYKMRQTKYQIRKPSLLPRRTLCCHACSGLWWCRLIQWVKMVGSFVYSVIFITIFKKSDITALFQIDLIFSAAGQDIGLIMPEAKRLSEKWTIGQKTDFRRQLWNFKDNLLAKGTILLCTSKPGRV